LRRSLEAIAWMLGGAQRRGARPAANGQAQALASCSPQPEPEVEPQAEPTPPPPPSLESTSSQVPLRHMHARAPSTPRRESADPWRCFPQRRLRILATRGAQSGWGWKKAGRARFGDAWQRRWFV
jgi:hypothetical protein